MSVGPLHPLRLGKWSGRADTSSIVCSIEHKGYCTKPSQGLKAVICVALARLLQEELCMANHVTAWLLQAKGMPAEGAAWYSIQITMVYIIHSDDII
jgi:hypothetical protein